MKLQREVPCNPPSDYNIGPIPRSVRLFVSLSTALILAAYLFGCDIKVETVDDEDIKDVTEACEMLFEDKIEEFKMWFDDYIKGEVAEVMIGLGCIPDNQIDIGWDCSMTLKSEPKSFKSP